VRVLKSREVPRDWDPRRQSVQKTYSYAIYNRSVYSPLHLGRAWQVLPPLDLAAMKRGAAQLLGRHDFSSFRAAGCEARHAVRTVKSITLSRRGALITLKVTADAFLYHMVRNIVGTLVQVGLGKFTPGQVKRVLRARDRSLAGPTAPACGLTLESIRFGRRLTRGLRA
jgi:tRNA pseudouridine38-40 synthase